MAIALKAGSPTSNNSSGSASCTDGGKTAAIAAGDVIVICSKYEPNSTAQTVSSVNDTQGNSYAVIGPLSTVLSSPIGQVAVYYAVAKSSSAIGANTVTVTWSATTSNQIVVAEGIFTGFVGTPAVGPNATANDSSGTTSVIEAAAINTTVAAALIVQTSISGTGSPTYGGGSTVIITDVDAWGNGYIAASSTGSYQPTQTMSGNDVWATSVGVIYDSSSAQSGKRIGARASRGPLLKGPWKPRLNKKFLLGSSGFSVDEELFATVSAPINDTPPILPSVGEDFVGSLPLEEGPAPMAIFDWIDWAGAGSPPSEDFVGVTEVEEASPPPFVFLIDESPLAASSGEDFGGAHPTEEIAPPLLIALDTPVFTNVPPEDFTSTTLVAEDAGLQAGFAESVWITPPPPNEDFAGALPLFEEAAFTAIVVFDAPTLAPPSEDFGGAHPIEDVSPPAFLFVDTPGPSGSVEEDFAGSIPNEEVGVPVVVAEPLLTSLTPPGEDFAGSLPLEEVGPVAAIALFDAPILPPPDEEFGGAHPTEEVAAPAFITPEPVWITAPTYEDFAGSLPLEETFASVLTVEDTSLLITSISEDFASSTLSVDEPAAPPFVFKRAYFHSSPPPSEEFATTTTPTEELGPLLFTFIAPIPVFTAPSDEYIVFPLTVDEPPPPLIWLKLISDAINLPYPESFVGPPFTLDAESSSPAFIPLPLAIPTPFAPSEEFPPKPPKPPFPPPPPLRPVRRDRQGNTGGGAGAPERIAGTIFDQVIHKRRLEVLFEPKLDAPIQIWPPREEILEEDDKQTPSAPGTPPIIVVESPLEKAKLQALERRVSILEKAAPAREAPQSTPSPAPRAAPRLAPAPRPAPPTPQVITQPDTSLAAAPELLGLDAPALDPIRVAAFVSGVAIAVWVVHRIATHPDRKGKKPKSKSRNPKPKTRKKRR